MHGGKHRKRCRDRSRSWSEGLGCRKGRRERTRTERLIGAGYEEFFTSPDLAENRNAPTYPPLAGPPPGMLGKSSMAIFMPGRSPSASAIRPIPSHGNGVAASIRVRGRGNIRAAPPPALTRPAPILSAHGRFFCRRGLRPIFRRGAIRGIGPSGNMRCGMQARS
jgi:hypothetical protein